MHTMPACDQLCMHVAASDEATKATFVDLDDEYAELLPAHACLLAHASASWIARSPRSSYFSTEWPKIDRCKSVFMCPFNSS